jgi:hypothetical protein
VRRQAACRRQGGKTPRLRLPRDHCCRDACPSQAPRSARPWQSRRRGKASDPTVCSAKQKPLRWLQCKPLPLLTNPLPYRGYSKTCPAECVRLLRQGSTKSFAVGKKQSKAPSWSMHVTTSEESPTPLPTPCGTKAALARKGSRRGGKSGFHSLSFLAARGAR